MIKNLLIFALVFIFCFPVFAQMAPKEMSSEEMSSEEMSSEDMPPENISPEAQQKFMKEIAADSPELAKFQNRLIQIQKEVGRIVRDYNMNKLSKKEAREKLKPLLKEQIEMMDNTDFLVEQQIFALLSQK